ncbi:hypothetical protein, partial [Streptomyces sp. NPDC048659]|uniref:hypothetical protein n=1 Tax=Streptomyces sp. NPDC048659 TaxID=3155489 RepID=UPI003443878D
MASAAVTRSTAPSTVSCLEREATEILLALRRFVAAPVPGTSWRLRAFLPASELIRVRLEDDVSRAVLIELPHNPEAAPASLGSWWYVGALRAAARWAADNTEAGVLDLGTLTAAGVLPDAVEVTADDGLDYVVADLVGDPYWHAPAATVAPDLYYLVGFDTRQHGVVRLYCVLAGVQDGVAALADVDEGGLHRRQHVLDLAQV